MSPQPARAVPGPTLPELFEAIYDRLKELSAMSMRSQPAGHTLQPTAVVNEAFLKLAERDPSEFESQDHFFATAAVVLRSVLVDHARRRSTRKRGAGRRGISVEVHEPLDRAADVSGVIELDDALRALSKVDPRAAKVAELRIFGGIQVEHVARLLGTSVPTSERDWRVARAFLEREYGVSSARRQESGSA